MAQPTELEGGGTQYRLWADIHIGDAQASAGRQCQVSTSPLFKPTGAAWAATQATAGVALEQACALLLGSIAGNERPCTPLAGLRAAPKRAL